MEDTFFSYVRVLFLQVWLVSVRLGNEGEDGKRIRDIIITFMWEDLEGRLSRYGKFGRVKKASLRLFSDMLSSCFVSYDEGLLDNDKVLAGAVWNNLIRLDKEGVSYLDEPETNDYDLISDYKGDPRALESLVAYIREMIHVLDKIPTQELIYNPKIKWTKPVFPHKLEESE